MTDFFATLENLQFSTWLRESNSIWAYPTMLTLHTIGLALLVGASAALLLAPQSGRETRTAIRRRARFARHRAGDAWAELADELAAVARRGGRRARRAMRRARWRASDVIA